MTKKDINKIVIEMKEYTKELKANPEKAKQFFVNADIYTKSGKLSKHYK